MLHQFNDIADSKLSSIRKLRNIRYAMQTNTYFSGHLNKKIGFSDNFCGVARRTPSRPSPKGKEKEKMTSDKSMENNASGS